MCDCGEEEIWKPIEGYEYEVSSCGRIKDENGKQLPIKTHQTSRRTSVRIPNKTVLVSRIVATAFIPNPEKFPLVSRKNETCDDRHAKNLFWSKKPIRATEGKPRPPSTRKVDQMTLEGKFLRMWDSSKAAAQSIGCKTDGVSSCCRGEKKTCKGFLWRWRDEQDIEGEIWKKYSCRSPNVVAVSNMGRILLKSGEKTYGRKDPSGYMKYSKILIHRIVAEAFCERRSDDEIFVNHISSQIEDNRAENLEWCTPAWNARHSYMKKKELRTLSVVETSNEIWKDIEILPGYRVSNRGKVAGPEGFYLKEFFSHSNLRVSIKGKHYTVKKLVAGAFIPNPEGKKNVHCKDGNPRNVSLENIQRCNRGEEEGMKRGSKKPDKILQMTPEKVVIREFETVERAVLAVKGTTKNGITRALAGRKEYNGFLWRYKATLDIPGEIWKTVAYKDKEYTVSSMGRILLARDKKTYGSIQRDGYAHYNGQKVHRIIASAFLPPPLPSQKYCNHISGDCADNRVENLEWVSSSGNIRHAHETGLISLTSREEFRNKEI
ncbi:HNH endonuclease [Tunisvirus fontaine2]|uniref:HNH homing endonuclease n=1 Tax=Tunisvirus fontaine2 TaxID=1421067 RepID=V9SGP6_9VIRU|nr:HNH endonuclease [Tunisvirus fontaine2]AHC55064.1 HNH homing endonuclease [Tunisvirus fontaine2]